MNKKELIILSLISMFLLTTLTSASSYSGYNSYYYPSSYTVYHEPITNTNNYYKTNNNFEETVSTSYDYYGNEKRTIVRKEKSTIEKKDYYDSYTPATYTIYYNTKSYGDRYYDDVVYHHPDYYVYPSTDWRYKPVYRYSDYGNDKYTTNYYYTPHYNSMQGYYNWRY